MTNLEFGIGLLIGTLLTLMICFLVFIPLEWGV